jgi:ABC-type multidrug transport system ATPase subunit
VTITQSGGSRSVKEETRQPARSGVRIEAEHLVRTVGRRRILSDVSLAIEPSKLVSIVGGSGTGKTTLLETLAGVWPADSGRVRFDNVDVYTNLDVFRTVLGYVPQDDIIHAELPLERTLRYAARLRMPSSASTAEIDAAVGHALQQLDLLESAPVRVSALSGGQRKRASIAVELLTQPRVFFLDEPTSGLDPATDAALLRCLRALADAGSTVVLTTHVVQDLEYCQQVIFLASGGYVAFTGTVDEARTYFGVRRIEEIYARLANELTPEEWARRFAEHHEQPGPSAPQRLDEAPPSAVPAAQAAPPGLPKRRRQAGPVRQWSVLTQRTFETMVRNPLTMAILLGSPAMVVVMFAILFQAGAFAFANPSPSNILMIVFWITFGAFFFGLTYGLLQIVTERAILRRETLVGMRLGAYLFSKVTVLLPFLLIVDVLMIVVLRGLDRLPAADVGTYLSMAVTLALDAAAALTLGLLTSAAVRNAAQATLALPMLCFPAVLFSGAILPVHVMAPVGAAISNVIPVRWAFEAVGRDLGVRYLLTHGGSSLGPPLVQAYGGAGTSATSLYWLYLVVFAIVFFAGAWAVLLRTTSRRVPRP